MIAAYMLVQTRFGKLKIVSSALKKLEAVKECHEIIGRFDIIVKIEVDDYEKFRSFIQNKILIMEGIRHTETLMVYDKVKSSDDEPEEREGESEEESSES